MGGGNRMKIKKPNCIRCDSDDKMGILNIWSPSYLYGLLVYETKVP
jgi:hypothetical protein